MMRSRHAGLVALVAGIGAGFAVGAFAPVLVDAPVLAQERPAVQRKIEITAKKFAFTPARIEVTQDDLVMITLHSADIAHSFTIDAYRIAKRVQGGRTVTFEFRADQPGTFPIYCNLRQEDGCRQMRGELVVKPR